MAGVLAQALADKALSVFWISFLSCVRLLAILTSGLRCMHFDKNCVRHIYWTTYTLFDRNVSLLCVVSDIMFNFERSTAEKSSTLVFTSPRPMCASRPLCSQMLDTLLNCTGCWVGWVSHVWQTYMTVSLRIVNVKHTWYLIDKRYLALRTLFSLCHLESCCGNQYFITLHSAVWNFASGHW